MTRNSGTIFEFDDFRLIPDEGLLLRSGKVVPLSPKAFAMLVMLVERHGHLVKKNEILDRVWGDTFVEEGVIPQSISSIRSALGENSKSPMYIRTEPKRGYRFIGDVRNSLPQEYPAIPDPQPLEEPFAIESVRFRGERSHFKAGTSVESHDIERAEIANKTPVDSVPPDLIRDLAPPTDPAENRGFGSRFYIAAGLVLLALFTGAGIFYLSQPRNTVASNDKGKRLAVLPLKPVDAETRDRGLEFAIADALILKLSVSKAFEVNRLNTVRKFIDLEKDPVDAGRELNVDYVLSSHYQIVDGRVRVTSQLLNIHAGSTEQTFRAEVSSTSIFQIQDAVANEIGNAVFSKFGTPASIFAARRGTDNEEAYSLYQQAWYLIDKGTAEDSAKAASLLDRVVEIDPNYSQAWAVRSHAYCQFAHQGGAEPMSVFTAAEPMLDRSMTLDPNNAMAYTIRGTINRDFHWNLPQAISDLKQAIELDPSTVLAHRVLAGAYYRNGQFAEALESEKRAVDLHPTSLADHWFLGNYLVAAGRKAEGITQLNRVVEMNPSFPPVYQSLWEIYHLEGEHVKAYENFMKLKELYSSPTKEMDLYKMSYEKAGWPAVLRTELELVLSKEPKGQYCNYKYYIAALAALLGDKELAFHYIDEAIRFRLIAVSFLNVDPKFAGLRSDPRFNAVVNRIGLTGRS